MIFLSLEMYYPWWKNFKIKIKSPSNIYLVAPVQIIFPEDQIVAVILGFLSFINTFWKKKTIT